MQITCTQKRICKDFEITNSRQYYGLHVQSNTLLLVMYLRTFRICVLKYMNLILFVFSLHLQGALKNASVKLDLLTDIDMLLMEGKGTIGRICHAIY